MRNALLFAAVLSLSACNTLHKFLGTSSTPADPVPDVIVIDSIAVSNNDLYDIRTVDSSITVEVKQNGAWVLLNRYDYSVIVKQNGGVEFGHICYPTFNGNGQLIYLVITSDPSVPKGTEFRLTSTLQHTAHALY